MFRRSRRKIIVSIMLSLIVLLVVTLAVVMQVSFREIRQSNQQMQQHFEKLYEPGDKPMMSEEEIEEERRAVTERSIQLLMQHIFIIGGAAILVLCGFSFFLARWIIRPLEENDKKQKQFISDASHELKTPVAIIGTNAQMLSRELGENEWLSNIRYENERMGDLVKQLLELSRAENTEALMEQVDLSRIVTGEVLSFDSLAFEQGKQIESNIAEDIHMTGNASQLTQLVSVLLDNALRHGRGSKIEVVLEKREHGAFLSVENEGEAIPPEKQRHLFDRFYRVSEDRNSEGHHYGLGLSIAKAVVEKHGGSIKVLCQEGKVCFQITLPGKYRESYDRFTF